MTHLLLALLDLGGTFVFAISGAVAAVRYRLDTFGVVVLAFAAGNAGGITRDLLIGAVPPVAIAQWPYAAVSVVAALIVSVFYPLVLRLRHPVLWLDAVGLAFFVVVGAEKALEFGLGPLAAIFMGTLTGIGGGMLRDVLVREIPTVLHADFYASAALAGATLVVGGGWLGLTPGAAALAGGLLCFFLRAMAIRHGWHLPAALQLAYRRRPSGDKQQDNGGDGG